ncbi:MAG TPA: hypothetical protein VK143_02330 [Burkholderiales bacterium]|nr:hypothetical protein [Burkholderiales bacterium]
METIRRLEALWTYSLRCAQAPVSAPACDSFWTAAGIVAVAAVALVALYILRRMVRNLVAVRDERIRVAERARIADEDTMAQYKADTDKLFAASSQENVEQQIKQALEERKKKDQWQRPGAGSKKDGPE